VVAAIAGATMLWAASRRREAAGDTRA
jgi:hypothetical protein